MKACTERVPIESSQYQVRRKGKNSKAIAFNRGTDNKKRMEKERKLGDCFCLLNLPAIAFSFSFQTTC